MTLNDTYEDFQKVIVYDNELTVGANKLQDINCTVRPEVVEDDFGVEVTTGGIYEFNGHPHLTCYTASVTGGVAVTADDVAVTELGVLFQRAGKEENLVIGNVGTGTNDVRQVKASSVSENAVLKQFQFPVLATYGIERAQVTAGGVPTSEVMSETMESKLVSGLYFTGELLDVDGRCGGYNLHFAWSTAMIAAEAIIRERN